jgi:hypothetical protein
MKPTSILRIVLPAFLLSALPGCADKPKASAAPVAASSPTVSPATSAARRRAIVTFCRKNAGRKVGNGECWTLANEAFKVAGARRPKGEVRVWGRRLDLKRESPQAGDILECDRTRFSDGSYVPTKHTAVIVGVHSSTLVRVAEQNYGGKRVKERDLDLDGVRSGRIYVYRPL